MVLTRSRLTVVSWARIGEKVGQRNLAVTANTYTLVDRFAELQPWSTPPCEWTAKLRDLSNPDKHRAMANLRSVVRVVGGDHPDVADLVPGIEPKPDETYVTMQVFFADTGDDVEDTLVMLQREVLALIQEFKPAFRV